MPNDLSPALRLALARARLRHAQAASWLASNSVPHDAMLESWREIAEIEAEARAGGE